MTAVILTPNFSGHDGISHLSRLIGRVCDDAVVLALHEPVGIRTVEAARVVGAGGNNARFAALALKYAATEVVDTVVVVHIHLAPAALAFAARGASLVSWLCGIEAWVPLNWSHRAALQRSRVVAAISSHTVGRFRAANPVFGNLAISVCHPGIVDRQGEVRDERRGRPVALIVGRMAANERYKGHDELLDVWQQVLQRVPDAQLRIVGDGDDRARLEAKAANLALGNSVVFLGRLSDADREDEYARCTVFVMPSRDEGFGLVFIEAMRAGRACIAAEGAACEIVAHGRTGLIVSPTSTAQLTEAVTGLLGDRRLAATMGAAGRTRFLDHFTDAAFRQRAAAVIQKPVAVGISA